MRRPGQILSAFSALTVLGHTFLLISGIVMPLIMITNRDIRAVNNTLTDVVDLLDSLLDTQECILLHLCDCQEEE